jgi:hypothetical protein
MIAAISAPRAERNSAALTCESLEPFVFGGLPYCEGA